jgi:DNA-binding NtrC family response regulator
VRLAHRPQCRGPAAEGVVIATILILEDDVFILQVAEILIGDQGHLTLSASDVAEALVHLNGAGHIDMLFTDIRLEASTLAGFDVARQGVALRPQMRVLYVSGSEMTNETNALFVEGGKFLRKPYGEAELKTSIDAALH